MSSSASGSSTVQATAAASSGYPDTPVGGSSGSGDAGGGSGNSAGSTSSGVVAQIGMVGKALLRGGIPADDLRQFPTSVPWP